MEERRKSERDMGEADILLAEISEEKTLPEKLILAISKDISMDGIGVQTAVFLPVDTELKIKVKLKEPSQLITAFAKVIWIQKDPSFELYNVGLEFFDTSSEIIKQLTDYILCKQNLQVLNQSQTMEYRIVSGKGWAVESAIKILEKKVNDLIQEGWEPIGGIMIVAFNETVYQTLVKKIKLPVK
ncbi:MAG: PilZ domain-containing protein [Smithella sp.]